MAKHDNEPRLLKFPTRVPKEHKLLYTIIVLQLISFIIHFLK